MITPFGWLLRAGALVAVSVISGAIWLAVTGDGTEPQPTKPPVGPPKGKYNFVQYSSEDVASCAEFSTGKIADFFKTHPCEHLTRALYTTTLPTGQKVLTSVVTARMPDAASAAQLNRLTTADGTGNIEDLVTSGREVPDDFPSLKSDYGYHSEQQDRLVVLGESAYFTSKKDDQQLTGITIDALRFGWPQDSAPR